MFYVIIYEYTFQPAKVQKNYEIRNLLSVFYTNSCIFAKKHLPLHRKNCQLSTINCKTAT